MSQSEESWRMALHTFSAGQFTDPNAPAGFAPFGVKNAGGGVLFVSFAKQDAARHDDVAGPGNGFIDEFTSDGQFIKRFATGTGAGGTVSQLNSPIGAAIAPAGFGQFGGDLLIGNFGDSHVSAFDPATGQFLGQLQDTSGHPLVLTAGITGAGGNTKGLWGIGFGNGQGGAGTQTMFFADGPNDETDGIFGEVNMAPAASAAAPTHHHHHHHHGSNSQHSALVSSADDSGAMPLGAATFANNLSAGGMFQLMDPTSGAIDVAMIAEHLHGKSHSQM